MTGEKTKKAKIEIVHVDGEDYYTLLKAAKEMYMSERSLRRECARHNIRYMRHIIGILLHPSWCSEYLRKRTVEPRKNVR